MIEVFLDGIPSAEGVGVLTPNRNVSLTGIGSAAAYGTLTPWRYNDIAGIESSEAVGSLSTSIGYVPPSIPYNRAFKAQNVSQRFSNPVLFQNATPQDDVPLGSDRYWQTFRLPNDYVRGAVGTRRTPPLTGFQVLGCVDTGWADTATLDWEIQRYDLGEGWQSLGTGTATGASYDNSSWFTVYFDPITLEEDWIAFPFRLGLTGRTSLLETFKEEVEYTPGQLVINGQVINAEVPIGEPYHLEFDGVPSTIYRDPGNGKTYFSVERGLTSLWTSRPNPLATQNSKVYTGDGEEGDELLVEGEEVSFNFRILAGIAEEGKDFLGNRYRSALATTSVNNISTLDNEHANQYWLSKPNPSKFAVESLYFDISNQDDARTVDTILLDPLTPGIFFSVYHSSEGEPMTSEDQWEEKLWTRVPQLFQTKQRTTHPLPLPITARYIKIEFTHLQPKWYAPGNFQKSILYKKHPKWVLDYFLLRYSLDNDTEDPFIARRLRVSYAALDLAYNYYLADLEEGPLDPAQVALREDEVLGLVSNDRRDQVDLDTYAKIRMRFNEYTSEIGSRAAFDYLLSTYALGANGQLTSGERVITPTPIEALDRTPNLTSQVSQLDREGLLYERGANPMFFFVPCRHKYREATADFKNDKAYFAGVKEIAFLRDRYSEAFDNPLYIESGGDTFNIQRNDFINEDGVWLVSGPPPALPPTEEEEIII